MEKAKLLLDKLKNVKFIFGAVSFFLGLEYFILGPFSFVQIGDGLQTIAERAIVACRSLLATGGINYWMPSFSGGLDRLSNAGAFSEIGNLFYILPPWIATAALMVGGVFVSGYFTFLLCREVLGFSKKVSVISGILFSSVFIGNIPFIIGMAVLPFVLFYLEKVFSSQKMSFLNKIFSFLVFGIIYSFSSSLVLTLPFTAIGIVFWFFIVRKQRSLNFYLCLLLFFLPACLLKFQEAWSLMINSPLSQRGAGTNYLTYRFKTYPIELYGQLLSLCFKSIPLGLAFLFCGLWLAKKSRLFWRTLVLILVLFFALPFYTLLISTKFGVFLGPFRFFDFTRILYLVPFYSAILFGYILSKLEFFPLRVVAVKNNKEISFSLQNILIVFCLAVVIYNNVIVKQKHFNAWIRAGSYQTNTQSPDVAFLANREKNSSPFRVATMSLRTPKTLNSFFPGFYGMENANYYANVIFRNEQGFFRQMAKNNGIVNDLYFLTNISGDEANKLKADFNPAKVVNMPLVSLFNIKYIVSDNLMNSPDLELLPTPSAANWQPWEKMSEIQKMKFKISENFSGRKALIYENKKCFSRFFLVKKIKSFTTEEALLAGLAASDEKVLRENVFLDKKDADKISELGGQSEKIEILNYSADKIKLRVASDGSSVLVISNNFSPYWEAYVNGEKTEIALADYTFMAVYLKNNSNDVELIYNPPYKF